MIRIAIVLFLLNSFFLFSENDFRSVKWGMSKEEVKKLEKESFIEEKEEGLLYNLIIDNKEFYLMYYFFENKLYQGVYRLNESFNDENDYLIIFEKFKQIIIEKYKEPSNDIEEIEDAYKEYLGMALSKGKAVYICAWQNLEKTNIAIMLNANKSYEISFLIVYNSKELTKIKNDKDKEKDKKNF